MNQHPPPDFTHHPHSIDHHLCVHPPALPYEDIDTISVADLKQDACLRALIALSRAGKPLTSDADPVAAFDAEPKLAQRALAFALRDALRQQLGRGIVTGRRLARWQRRLSLDHGFADMADPAHQDALDAIVDHVAAQTRLLLLWNHGLGNLSQARSRKLLRLLKDLQRRKDDGMTVVPAHLRQRLRLLRQGTDLPISTRDL